MSQQVVIIEDNSWQAEVLQRSLERSGIKSQIVNSIFKAIDVIDKIKPAAIVLDINLPATNGLALIHELRSHADLASIPIVVCSNLVSDLPASFASDYNVAAVVDKATLHPNEINDLIKRLISGWA